MNKNKNIETVNKALEILALPEMTCLPAYNRADSLAAICAIIFPDFDFSNSEIKVYANHLYKKKFANDSVKNKADFEDYVNVKYLHGNG